MALKQTTMIKDTISKTKSINTWIKAYKVLVYGFSVPKRKAWYKTRLEELKTWDTCNGHESERQTKIEALNFLIGEL